MHRRIKKRDEKKSSSNRMFRFAYGRDGFSFFTGEQNRGRSRKGYAQSARYLTEKSKTNKISKVTKLKSPGKNHSGKWIPGRQLGMAEDPAGSNSGAGDRCREGTGRTECDAHTERSGRGCGQCGKGFHQCDREGRRVCGLPAARRRTQCRKIQSD